MTRMMILQLRYEEIYELRVDILKHRIQEVCILIGGVVVSTHESNSIIKRHDAFN